MSDRLVVHVAVEGFFETCREHELDELVQLTDRFDARLDRHAGGWIKPSADEAVLVAEPPWEPGGKALDWAERLREDLSGELGLDVSVGIAGTRVAARICARMARPRGILLWMEGHEDRLIGGLPLEELDELTPDQLSRLRSRGIRTLDALARLGAEEVRDVLGTRGDKVIGLIKGADWAVDTAMGSRLSKATALLTQRLARRLERADRSEDGVSLERYSLLPRPMQHWEDLFRAAARLLEHAPRRPHSVVGLALTATGLTTRAGQLQLFDSERPREVVVRLGRRAPVSA
jgi:hypothetical protein